MNINVLNERAKDIYEYQEDLDFVHRMLTILKDRFCRKNLQVDGITEGREETCII